MTIRDRIGQAAFTGGFVLFCIAFPPLIIRWEESQIERSAYRANLYQQLSQVADTNPEIIRLYEQHGITMPLPNLTNDQIEQHLANYRQGDER